jgi:hypothetical protein
MDESGFNGILQAIFGKLKIPDILDEDCQQLTMMLARGKRYSLPR